MKLKSFALGGVAIVGLALAGVPASAYTHHPSTPAEDKQTDDLNAQALTQAQGQPTQAGSTEMGASPTQDAMASNSASQATSSSGTVALTTLANSPQTLANASVETSSGQAVGAVQKVVTDGNGKAQIVDIALLGSQSKIVAIDAAQLAYDQSRNVVVAQLSVDQIQALPAAPQG
jgi:hypothetical protein